jgi:hypothetical protein
MPDFKRCVCGYLYLDTAVGKACHMRWCERLSLALSAGGLALDVPDSVSMLRLTCAVHVSPDNRRVDLPGRHSQLCFYLASTTPDQPPDSSRPSTPAEAHGRRAVALKAELGHAANKTQSRRDFTAVAHTRTSSSRLGQPGPWLSPTSTPFFPPSPFFLTRSAPPRRR